MSDLNNNVRTTPGGQVAGRASVQTDAGLRAHMLHIYNYMGAALQSPAWPPSASTCCR